MSDVVYFDEGSVVRITPQSKEARAWIDANVVSEGWQWLGASLCVDWRFGSLVLAAVEDAGFEVEAASRLVNGWLVD